MISKTRFLAAALCAAVLAATPLAAQVTKADYGRAMGLRDKYQYLTVNVPEPATWIEKTTRFYYRKSVKGGHEFVTGGCGNTEETAGIRSRAARGGAFERDGREVHGAAAAFQRIHVCRRGASD